MLVGVLFILPKARYWHSAEVLVFCTTLPSPAGPISSHRRRGESAPPRAMATRIPFLPLHPQASILVPQHAQVHENCRVEVEVQRHGGFRVQDGRHGLQFWPLDEARLDVQSEYNIKFMYIRCYSFLILCAHCISECFCNLSLSLTRLATFGTCSRKWRRTTQSSSAHCTRT